MKVNRKNRFDRGKKKMMNNTSHERTNSQTRMDQFSNVNGSRGFTRGTDWPQSTGNGEQMRIVNNSKSGHLYSAGKTTTEGLSQERH